MTICLINGYGCHSVTSGDENNVSISTVKYRKINYLFIGVLFILFSLPSLSLTAQLAVVVNPQNEIEALSSRQISDIYLGRRRTFPTGEPILILEHERNSEIRANFFRLLNGMSLKRLNAYWARLHFSGAVQPPSEIPDSETVRELVGNHKDAIGYIETGQVDDSVRVILLLKDEK